MQRSGRQPEKSVPRRTVVLRVVDSWLDGSELVSVLESQGLTAAFESAESRAYNGLFKLSDGAGRVLVFEDDRQRAESIIEEFLRARRGQKEDQQ